MLIMMLAVVLFVMVMMLMRFIRQLQLPLNVLAVGAAQRCWNARPIAGKVIPKAIRIYIALKKKLMNGKQKIQLSDSKK